MYSYSIVAISVVASVLILLWKMWGFLLTVQNILMDLMWIYNMEFLFHPSKMKWIYLIGIIVSCGWERVYSVDLCKWFIHRLHPFLKGCCNVFYTWMFISLFTKGLCVFYQAFYQCNSSVNYLLFSVQFT